MTLRNHCHITVTQLCFNPSRQLTEANLSRATDKTVPRDEKQQRSN
jgi:hypothetical protein